jgi:hypothetical protein
MKIMKKIYNKPEIEVIRLQQQSLLAGSVAILNENAEVTGEVYNDAPLFEDVDLTFAE